MLCSCTKNTGCEGLNSLQDSEQAIEESIKRGALIGMVRIGDPKQVAGELWGRIENSNLKQNAQFAPEKKIM